MDQFQGRAARAARADFYRQHHVALSDVNNKEDSMKAEMNASVRHVAKGQSKY